MIEKVFKSFSKGKKDNLSETEQLPICMFWVHNRLQGMRTLRLSSEIFPMTSKFLQVQLSETQLKPLTSIFWSLNAYMLN